MKKLGVLAVALLSLTAVSNVYAAYALGTKPGFNCKNITGEGPSKEQITALGHLHDNVSGTNAPVELDAEGNAVEVISS